MRRKVLLLNSSYEPIDSLDMERAMILILNNKVEILHINPERKIRTVTVVFPYPEVVRLKKYVHWKRRTMTATKRNILIRDNFTCQYCGSKKNLTIDHILPVSRGGENTWKNMVAACNSCNNVKADRTPEEAGMVLAKKPFIPGVLSPYISYAKHYGMDSWKDYIFMN